MLYDVFSNIIVSHPTHIAHKVFGFLQYWYQLSSKEERVKAEILLNKLHNGLQRL